MKNTLAPLLVGCALLQCATLASSADSPAKALPNPTPATTLAQATVPATPASSVSPASPAARAPKIGLVLGGGGARGFAHIGVLKKLEEMRIPISCIAGTSMGGLVAGAYSSGLKARELEQFIVETDWRDLFTDAGAYEDFSPRNKQMSQNFIPGAEGGVRDNALKFPSAVLSGHKIKFYISRMVNADKQMQLIENQKIPLSLVTTDIASGQKRAYTQGDLSAVMRATMSVPGLMAPVKYDDRTLVDGGLVDNVPISEVQKLCQPDVVIAVNVGSPLLTASQIETSPFAVAAQMVAILTEQNVEVSLTKLRPQTDIYLKPDLEGITAGDFERGEKTIAQGYKAAQAAEQELKKLSVSHEQYVAWLETNKGKNYEAKTIHAIEVAGVSPDVATSVKSKIEQKVGHPLDTKSLEADLLDVYSDGQYYQLDYRLTHDQSNKLGGATLKVFPTQKPWGPNFVRTGINFGWGNIDKPAYNVRLGYHMTQINESGGELLVGGQVGERDRIGVNWYQPTSAGSNLFSEVDVSYLRQRSSLYGNTERLAEYLASKKAVDIAMGYLFPRHGTIKIGARKTRQDFEMNTGTAIDLPRSGSSSENSWYVQGELDRMNRVYFPTKGWRARVEYEKMSDFSKATFAAAGAQSLSDYVMLLRGSHTYSPTGTLTLADAASVGGPLTVAGLAQGQILGDDASTLGLQLERIIGQMPLGIRGDLRLGLQLEAARVKTRFTETQQSGVVRSFGLYLGGETPVGAIYVGIAKATDNKPRFYIFLGTP